MGIIAVLERSLVYSVVANDAVKLRESLQQIKSGSRSFRFLSSQSMGEELN